MVSMTSEWGVEYSQIAQAAIKITSGIFSNQIMSCSSKSRIVQIVDAGPAAIAGVILIAVLTLTKLYHATQRLN